MTAPIILLLEFKSKEPDKQESMDLFSFREMAEKTACGTCKIKYRQGAGRNCFVTHFLFASIRVIKMG